MATRFYLSASGETVPISPSPDAAWEDASILARVLCNTVKRNLAMADVSFSDSDAAEKDILFRQYISLPMSAGQTITGSQSIKGQCRVFETLTANALFFTIGIRIIAANGITVQKTILPVTRDNVEISFVSLINRQFTATSNATNYVTIEGDRLVIEIGAGGNPIVVGSHSSTLRLGDASVTDLTEDNSSTLDDNPWIQLNDTLTFITQSQAPRSVHQFRQRRI